MPRQHDELELRMLSLRAKVLSQRLALDRLHRLLAEAEQRQLNGPDPIGGMLLVGAHEAKNTPSK